MWIWYFFIRRFNSLDSTTKRENKDPTRGGGGRDVYYKLSTKIRYVRIWRTLPTLILLKRTRIESSASWLSTFQLDGKKVLVFCCCRCHPSQKISRKEEIYKRDLYTQYTHTTHGIVCCTQYCVFAKPFFLSIFYLVCCALSSVFRLFLSLGRQVADFFFHLTELQIHPIRIGYVQSQRGEGFFFPLFP